MSAGVVRTVALLLCALAAAPVQADGNPFRPDPHTSAFGTYGDAMQYLLPLGAAGVTLARRDHEGLRQIAQGCALTIGGTHLLKWVFDRTPLGRRPDGGTHSFPSGHTSAAMCGAMGLQSRYGNATGLPALALATTVGISRIGEQRHHVRDVAASTVLAWGSARAVGEGNAPIPAAVPAAILVATAAYGQWGPVTRKEVPLQPADSGQPPQPVADLGLALLPDPAGRLAPTLHFAFAW